jgi:DnaJ family protein A protein 2
MGDKSYYDILGVSKNASESEITQAYKKMARKYHPDKLPEEKKEWGEMMIKELNEARDILNDPEKREIYDKFGKKGLEGGAGGFPFSGGGGFPFPGGSGFPFSDIGDLFGGMRKKKRDVPPLQVRVELSLEEIYAGKDIEMEIKRYNLCGTCNATGFADKKDHQCTTCNGKGVVMKTMQIGPGMIQQAQHKCNDCRGTGSDSNNESYPKCSDCSGQKVIKDTHTIKFSIEPGVREDEIIEIRNEGHEIPKSERTNSQSRGNIQVVISEKQHSIFKRGVVLGGRMDPANLAVEMALSLEEALCGFKREFTYLNGKKMYIIEDHVIKPGDAKFVPGKGLPVRGKPYKFGDLFIKYDITFPTTLTSKQKGMVYYGLTDKSIDKLDLDVPDDESDNLIQAYDVDDYNSSKSNYDEDSDDEMDGMGEGVQCHTQ